MTHPTQPSARIGRERDLIAAPRLDNLATSYAGVRALVDAAASQPATSGPRAVRPRGDRQHVRAWRDLDAAACRAGAIVLAAGGTRDDYWRALAGTVIASGDMGHATHPNYADRHEPLHQIASTAARSSRSTRTCATRPTRSVRAAFRLACEQAGVPMQTFVTRSDLPCGSTVGRSPRP
jgi:aspartyl aminopeptidase